uniref:TIR domain-containing protein n=1 Tax=Anopheles quadriannulatus TaxID=34691 RepID=A0A182XBQ2_ANOQN
MYCVCLTVLLVTDTSTGNDCTITNRSRVCWIVECPGSNVHLSINVKNRKLNVTCSDKPNFELLRDQLNLRSLTFDQLIYQDCPLPVGYQSLLEFLSAFLDHTQLSYIVELILINNADLSANVTLDPPLFAGLHKLQTLVIDNYAVSFDKPLPLQQLPSGVNRFSGSILHQQKQHHQTIDEGDWEMNIMPSGLVSIVPNLQMLTLHRNNFKQVEHLAKLPSLTYFNISSNQLMSLHDDMFYGLPNLTFIDLSSNKLTRLSAKLFRMNKNLNNFIADNQNGSRLVLEDKLFADLRRLIKVSVSNCKITALPECLFAGATGITFIDFSNNKLQSLPEHLFRGLSNLRWLYLQNNELMRMLPDTLLQDAINLRVLHLCYNKLTMLNKHLLKSLRHLEKLHLEHNQLHMIDVDAFTSQTESLITLNLSRNSITLNEDNRDVFYSNEEINITSGIIFSTLNKVQYLDLSFNAIVKILDPFKNFMKGLRTLDLSHNLITHIGYKDLLFPSPNIDLVNLESNKITHLDFDRSRIETRHRLPKEILLANNPLNCDCMSYPLVTYLKAEPDSSKSFLLKGLQCAQPSKLFGLQPQDVQLEDLVCEIDTFSEFCPAECKCYKRAVDQCAIVNCNAANLTRVPVIHSPSNIRCNFIELHLAQNKLHYLSNAGEGWNFVRVLNVSNNSLSTLSAKSLPEMLELLDVSGNQLTEIDAALIVKLNQSTLHNISLALNPWDCYCENQLLSFVVDNVARITDYYTLQCFDGKPINLATLKELCGTIILSRLYISVAVSMASVGCLLCIWLYAKFNLAIKVWLFRHNLLQWLVTEEHTDMNKRYDAFISYSHKDEEFVTKELLPRLESEELNFKICWHVRDFVPGEMIANEIAKAVEESRRTIIILSLNYIDSMWGQMEFSTAYLQSLVDKHNRVIPIIYQDIGDIDQLDPQLRAYLKTNTYVRWDDPWFWDKLHYAMPRKRRPKDVQTTDSMRMASGDKLNLPIIMTPPIK